MNDQNKDMPLTREEFFEFMNELEKRIDVGFDRHNARFNSDDARFDSLEKRMERVERDLGDVKDDAVNQIDSRMVKTARQ